MKHTQSLLTFLIIALFISFAAFGQTVPSEPKHLQLPDMAGYDWSSETQVPSAVADDWLCENGLPVNKIVWWGAYYEPAIFPYWASDNWTDPTFLNGTPSGTVTGFNIGIFSNKEHGECFPWSMPDELFYSATISIANANEILYGVVVKPGGQCENLWQYNAILVEPFFQEQGQIYWLSIQAINAEGYSSAIQWGWHQTDYLLYNFGEYAVQIGFTPNECEEWDLRVDTEMAFALYTVPEPSIISIMILFAVGFGLKGKMPKEGFCMFSL